MCIIRSSNVLCYKILRIVVKHEELCTNVFIDIVRYRRHIAYNRIYNASITVVSQTR